MSDIERKILEESKKSESTKLRKHENAVKEFSWWKYDDKDTFFVLTTKRKNTFKKGD